MPRTRAKCPVCQRGPYSLGNLYDHLRFVHWWRKEKIDELKLTIKNTKFEGRQPIECVCGKVYYSYHGFHVHREKAHGVPIAHTGSHFPVTCPACHKFFRKGEELANHCNEMHREQGGQDFTMIEGTFATHEEFEQWIDSVERLTKVNFTKRTSRACREGRSHIFICKHARGRGADVDPKEVKERFKNSDRVHSHCPAFIRVTENVDGSIGYRGCLGHLGHKVGIAKPKRTPRQKFRRWQTHRRHKDALLFYSCRLDTAITELSDDTWAVQSTDGYEYTVTVTNPCNCDEYNNIHCDRCAACPRQIRCNCSDLAHQDVACIHAHAVATFMEKARRRLPNVQHYLAAEMPGTSTTPALSEHDTPPPDTYGSDEEEHFVEDLATQQKFELQMNIAPSKTPQLEPSLPEVHPKVTVEPLQRVKARTKVKNEPKSVFPPPRPGFSQHVVTLREEAREELQQFQGLDEKLHLMLQTCMQSNLPHVIRDIRATIESKLSEIMMLDGDRTPKTRLHKPEKTLKQNEAGPSSVNSYEQDAEYSGEHFNQTSTQPGQKAENATPATRKVLRREFLEARSSRIPSIEEEQKHEIGVRPKECESEQLVQMAASVPGRKVLKREFVEASSCHPRLLVDKRQDNDTNTENSLNSPASKAIRKEGTGISALFVPEQVVKMQARLAPLPPGFKRVVKQIVTTQNGRRVVKRIIVRKPMHPSGRFQVVACEKSVMKQPKELAEHNESAGSTNGFEQDRYDSNLMEGSSESAIETATRTLSRASTEPDISESQSDRHKQLGSSYPLFEKAERPLSADMSSEQSTADTREDVTSSPEQFHRTESETSKDGARVVKKIYARRGSEWVLKRVVIRPATEQDIARSRDESSAGLIDDPPGKFISGEDTSMKDAPRVTKRMVVRRGVGEISPNGMPSSSSPFIQTPVRRTSDLIRKSLATALTPKTDKPPARPETLCLMCGKAEPPEHKKGERFYWLGCTNVRKCHVRAHEKCLREAKERCFVCHAGTWVRVQVKSRFSKDIAKASAVDNTTKDQDTKKSVNAEASECPQTKSNDDRSPALCEVNS